MEDLVSIAKKLRCNHLDVMYERVDEVEDSRRTRILQKLQQWSRLMQNGQKFESVLWRMEVTVNVSDRVT